MKKIILFFLLFLPFTVCAYSTSIIPGGETLGIDINSEGVIVIGFYKVDNGYINKFLQVGDKIKVVENTEVESVSDLVTRLEGAEDKEHISIEYERNGKMYKNQLTLQMDKDTYKTGLYVKGNIVGIGTLTYIDTESKVYGLLGHVINESKSNSKVDIRDGFSYFSTVSSFTRSVNGNPGSKNASISSTKFGTVLSNTEVGVFGKVFTIPEKETLEIAKMDEVRTGTATIYTTNLDNVVKEYEIEILEIDKKHETKNFYFEITDEELLQMSGGVVQGMSGSPIVQNGKVIGAVTRVLVDDVKKGYGISIVTMLEEGDKNK